MKRIIQVCSMLVLSIAFLTVAAQAQANSRIEAKIPFDFNVGDKTYVAGDYVLKLQRVSMTVVALSLEDKFGNQLQSVSMASNGDSADGQARLIFDRESNERYLSRVLTSEKGFSLDSVGERKKNSKREEVAVLRIR